MPLPTRTVSCAILDSTGDPVASARVEFRLTTTEIYDGLVVPERVLATTDEDGLIEISLFPNALGSQGSQYQVRAYRPSDGRKVLEATATVPDADCELQDIIDLGTPVALSAAASASATAQAAAVEAKAWANRTGSTVADGEYSAKHYALQAADVLAAADDSAEQAAASAEAAGASAITAAASQDAASTSAGAASASAAAASGSATAAAGSASSASTQASAALASANNAASDRSDAQAAASAAAASQTSASTSATTATTQAGVATAQAGVATAQAAAAASSASAAAGSASAASTSAGQASTSAASASGSAIAAADSAADAAASAATFVPGPGGYLPYDDTNANGRSLVANPTTYTGPLGGSGITGLSKGQVGLANVDNTSDASKPVSTAQQAALDLKANLASPALTGTPTTPTAATATNTTQIASTAFVQAVVSSAVGGAGALVAANNLSDLANATTARSNLGLGNVSNTSDAAKPVSTAQQAALDLKANLASPALTGAPTAPTASGGTNTTQIATTAFVHGAVSGVTASSIGLGSVNNTADSAKPVSTAQQAAIDDAKTKIVANYQTGSAYTLVLTDAGKRVLRVDGSANTTTVPLNSSVAFPVDTVVYVQQYGAGASSIVAAGGVTILTATGLAIGGQYRMVALIKEATDTWSLVGASS
jgi:hypothetical protein